MSHKTNRIAQFVRWSDWGPGKVPVLCFVLLYIGLTRNLLSPEYVLYFVLFFVYAMLHSALGYVANDWGDRTIDAQHAKPNAFNDLSPQQGKWAFLGLFVLAIVSGLPFIKVPYFLPLWAGWTFFALAYSLEPFRLKERGTAGLIFSFLAQWSLPIMLAFAAFGAFGNWDMWVFVVALTISGATLEIGHQRYDRLRDMSTQTSTMATRTSVAKLDTLYQIALLLDKLALGAIVITLTFMLPDILVIGIAVPTGIVLCFLYLLLLMVSLAQSYKAARLGIVLDPYYSSQQDVSKLLHETFPNLVLPVYLLLLATFLEPILLILLLLFLYYRLVLGQADLLWPWRMLQNWWHGRKQSPSI